MNSKTDKKIPEEGADKLHSFRGIHKYEEMKIAEKSHEPDYSTNWAAKHG